MKRKTKTLTEKEVVWEEKGSMQSFSDKVTPELNREGTEDIAKPSKEKMTCEE